MASMGQNLSLKLFSLLVATVLFLFVTVESVTPVDVAFPIEFRTADDIILTAGPTTLNATLQGPWATFRSYELDTMAPLSVDLLEAQPGTMRVKVQNRDLVLPPGMKVVSLNPSELEVILDRKVERLVPVNADVPERPAFGYAILDVQVVPARVRVSGPMTNMQTLEFVSTRAVDVSGREDDLDIEVDLRPPPPPLKLVDKTVQVLVEIGEEFVQRDYDAIPVKVEHPPRGVKVVPATVSVSLRGPRKIIDKLEKVGVVVDAWPEAKDGLRKFGKTVALEGGLPDRTQWVGPVPKVELQVPRRRRRGR